MQGGPAARPAPCGAFLFLILRRLPTPIKKIIGDDVVVDIGFKSEGIVSKREWETEDNKSGPYVEPKPGDEIEVLLESVEEWSHEIEEKGREEGRRQFFLRLLEVKFGALDKKIRARVEAADAQRLMEWGERVLTAERLADVFGH